MKAMDRMELSDHWLPNPVPTLPADDSAAWRRGQLTSDLLSEILDDMAAAADESAEISDEALLGAWHQAIEDFRSPGGPARRALDVLLAPRLGMSPPALQAALVSILDGVSGPAARAVVEAAAGRRVGRPVGIILASNIPALAVQALLPSLALRRPVLLKSSSHEPWLTPLLLARLVHYEPRLRPVLGAVTWPGETTSPLETAFLQRLDTVIAYGGGPAMASLSRRTPGRLIAFGPKISLAIVGDAEPVVRPAWVAGLARDIALFEQRGCLSVQAICVVGADAAERSRRLADALADALRQLAVQWPAMPEEHMPGEPVAALQAIRDEATMRGLYQPSLQRHQGTVIVEESEVREPQHHLQPSPGGRCVRIYPLADEATVMGILTPWRQHLQGVALAGRAWALEPFLRELGVSRCALPGELQQVDTGWRNGGISLLDALAEGPHASST